MTGKKKFSNVMPSIALAAEPLNHFSPTIDEAKTAIKSTPDTYSGVAAVAIEKVESARSSLLPSRMPARIPMISAAGIITIRTQNISTPVSPSRYEMISETGSLNTVDMPQLP